MPSNQAIGNEFGINDVVDGTPKMVGAIVIGSVLLIAAFKASGFRFNFGVSGKVG